MDGHSGRLVAGMAKLDSDTKKTILKKVGIPLRDSRPSTTRSDTFCEALRRQGMNEDTWAADIAAMRAATRQRSIWVYGGNGEKGHAELIDEPDYKTRLEAAKLQMEAEGGKYSPQKAQDQPVIIQILNQLAPEVRAQVEPVLENRLKSLLKPGDS